MTGICHICRNSLPIAYCTLCGHWFCADCLKKWGGRAMAFVKHLVAPAPFCCGPNGSEMETPIGVQLDELDYLRLTRARDQLDVALARAELSVQQARAAFSAALTAAAQKYGFDARTSHRFDDATCRLIPEDEPPQASK